MERMRL